MDPENEEDAASIEVDATVITEGGEPVAVVVDLPEGEEPEPEGSEVVVVASIQAERDVTIAAIHADVERAHIEARAEEVQSWQEEAESLRSHLTRVEERLEALSLVQVSTLPPLVEEEPVVEEPIQAETMDLTLQSTSLETSEMETVALPENGAESPAVLAAPSRRKRRLI